MNQIDLISMLFHNVRFVKRNMCSITVNEYCQICFRFE